jgi:arylsulfatase A-like enzyme
MIGAPRPWLHDELVHVPLILRMPKAADAGLRVSALTQPVDLLPTFMEILGQPLQRRGLWPLLRGEVTELRSFAFAAMRVGAFESWLMRTMDAAFHLHIAQPEHEAPRAPQLFLKPEDRWEVNDMCQRLGDTAEDMERALRAFAEEIKQPIAPSER